jgi:hypothetical protein
MTPAHRASPRRWPVLVVLAAVIVGLAFAARSPGGRSPGGPPPAPVSQVGATGAESSAFYCTGQTTAAGRLAPGLVILTNTGARTVRGTIVGVTDTGAKVAARLAVAARSELVAAVPAPRSGTWLSEIVTLSGGGVAVTQALEAPAGVAEAPCQSSTARQWFFPGGVTAGTNALFIALFNPTATPDVVDMSFATAKGAVHPINFQGLVLQPGQTQVESISPFVQNQPVVATTVSTRTGRLVASELELFSGEGSGLSIVPGSPRVEREWTLPQNVEAVGGSSSIDVYNPGALTEDVTVRTRLDSGPLAPFTARVPPYSVWVLATADETRIPPGDPYSAVVAAKGGGGVVVGRIVMEPDTAQFPQDGVRDAVDALSASPSGGTWVMPSPGSSTTPALTGVAPDALALTNLSGRHEAFAVELMRPSGLRTVASGHIAPSQTFSLAGGVLSRAGFTPLLVHATGRVAVTEVLGPTGGFGAVTMPGIPLAGAAGG